jgi:GntR family transcriptional regulator/MocR family aminotransferase
VEGVAAGLHLVVGLPEGVDEDACVAAAGARGIALAGIAEHAVEPRPAALLLGYGRIAEPAIARGVAELVAAVRSAA